MPESKSEVARFRQEQATQKGLYGVAVVASHASITACMERGAEYLLTLLAKGKHKEVARLMETPIWRLEGKEPRVTHRHQVSITKNMLYLRIGKEAMLHKIVFRRELTEAAPPGTCRTPAAQSGASLASPATSPANPWALSSLSPLILVVDDSATVRKILETCLRRAGYQVASFPDGVTALRWLLTPGVRLPDLLLLDIEMPGMDGYAVAQYLKTRPQSRSIPIVMLSGRRGVLDRLKARLAGAQHYLTKPFRTQSLLAVVQEYLGATSLVDKVSMHMDSRGTRSPDAQSFPERMSIYG